MGLINETSTIRGIAHIGSDGMGGPPVGHDLGGGLLSALDVPTLPFWITGPWANAQLGIEQNFRFVSFNPTAWYVLIIILIVASVLGVNNLYGSRLGRAWMGVREDETAAAAMGVNLVERDSKYDPQTEVQDYNQISGQVAMIAQSLGSPTTKAIQPMAEAFAHPQPRAMHGFRPQALGGEELEHLTGAHDIAGADFRHHVGGDDLDHLVEPLLRRAGTGHHVPQPSQQSAGSGGRRADLHHTPARERPPS